MSRRRFLLSLLSTPPALAVYRLTPGAPPASDTQVMIGIDHMPLAVGDLDSATETYRRLGFAIKPGHLHADGIRNNHVKFEDGAGIELITASSGTDALTTRYRKLLAQGEGPAFVGFHTGSLSEVKAALNRRRIGFSVNDGLLEPADPALQWLFLFEGNNRSATDRPEHFAHPNSAQATIALWIAGGNQTRMLEFFTTLGAQVHRKRVYVPDATMAPVAELANGEIIFLPAQRQVITGRPIVGVVFRTADLAAARSALQAAGVKNPVEVSAAGYRSVFAPPQDTHGVWIEFREGRK